RHCRRRPRASRAARTRTLPNAEARSAVSQAPESRCPRMNATGWRATVLRMLLSLCALLLAAAPGGEDSRFEAFAQKYVQELIDRDPEAATRLGEHRNDHRLNDYSAKGVERDLQAARAGLKELARIDLKKLSAENAVDSRILRNQLESQT